MIRRAAEERVYPERPQDAWRAVAGTDWGQIIDIESNLERMDAADMRYAWSDGAVDNRLADPRVEHRKEDRAAAIRAYWKKYEREAKLKRDAEEPTETSD